MVVAAAAVAPSLPAAAKLSPPPQRRRQAVTNVALSRCRHSLAAAKLPTTSRCRAPATAAAAPPFVGWLLRCYRAAATASLPQAAANIALSRCRHRLAHR